MSLVEIPIESYESLRDKFKVDWPKHIIAFNLLDTFHKRNLKAPDGCKFGKFYSLNGDWESDGTFLLLLLEREILFATLDESHEKLKAALKLFPFNKEMNLFMCTRDTYHSTLHEVIKELGLNIIFENSTVMKFIDKEDAIKLDYEIPENFQLRPVNKANAEKINSVWPHRSDNSVKFIEYLINYNEHIGLFNEETNELVAWCLKLDFGSLATLQVDEKHFRKGYGAIVAKAISKKIAMERDIDITANVICENFKSLNLFQKIGFKEIDKNHWIGVSKTE